LVVVVQPFFCKIVFKAISLPFFLGNCAKSLTFVPLNYSSFMSMKREITFKSLLLSAALLSLLAFTFVNAQSNGCSKGAIAPMGFAKSTVEDKEACDESRGMNVPDVTVLGRLWDIAHRLLDKTR
jgi:hypothetical protein